MSWLTVYNNICYCSAYCLLLSVGRSNWRKDIAAALGLLTASLLLMDWVRWYQLAYPVLMALVYRRDDGGYLHALAHCFGGIFLLWLVVTSGYVLILFTVPRWAGSVSYNVAMGALSLTCGIVVRLRPRLARGLLRPGPTSRPLLGIQVLIIAFFQLVNPLLNLAGSEPLHQAVYMLSLHILLFGVARFAAHARAVEHRNRELAALEQHQQEIQRQYDAVIALRHYYSNLIGTMGPLIRDGETDRLLAYFEAYVAPVHVSALADREILQGIQDEPLRNLLDVTTATVAATIPGVKLWLQVDRMVTFSPALRRPVFSIASVWLDNAVASLKGQGRGRLEISLTSDGDQVSIRIANSVPESFSVAHLHPSPAGGHGYGLGLVRETVAKYAALESMTHFDGGMLVQQLLIKGESFHV